MALYRTSQQVVSPPAECRSVFDFWHGLAHRMGLDEYFPWPTVDDLLDHRIQKVAPDFARFAEEHAYIAPRYQYKKYEQNGFATPSGKVELASTILEDMGFASLPNWRAAPPPDPAYPLTLFTGVRDDPFFQTGHRHIASLRKRQPNPMAFLSPSDAKDLGIAQNDEVTISTKQGSVLLKADIRDDMPAGVVRVPHGWWLPERPEGDGTLSGAWIHADAQICPDDADHRDPEQGIPHLKGIACRVVKKSAQTSWKSAAS
jgi:anaerobic selenocysteine-containing dehydrogenase